MTVNPRKNKGWKWCWVLSKDPLNIRTKTADVLLDLLSGMSQLMVSEQHQNHRCLAPIIDQHSTSVWAHFTTRKDTDNMPQWKWMHSGIYNCLWSVTMTFKSTTRSKQALMQRVKLWFNIMEFVILKHESLRQGICCVLYRCNTYQLRKPMTYGWGGK